MSYKISFALLKLIMYLKIEIKKLSAVNQVGVCQMLLH
jgi:hypothetical protein